MNTCNPLLYRGYITQITDNQMDNEAENQMQLGFIGAYRVRV